jgi:hypothetical protein
MTYTNNSGVSLALAVWLADDDYDHDARHNYISVTELIKSPRQIILARRVPQDDAPTDIITLFKSRLGQSLHGSIERSWKSNYRKSMAALRYPQKVIDRVQINPVNPGPDVLAVYIEQRVEKEFDGVIVGGKYDMVIDGQLIDHKSTSVFAFMYGSSIGKWILQGSVYRLLNQDKITDDHLRVQLLFTDWSRAAASSTAGYPATPVLEHPVQLLSVGEAERYVRGKLQELRKYWDAPEIELPQCTEEDLWRDSPQYKYYAKSPAEQKRSTKNFDNLAAANAHRADQGKGVVVTVPGEARACQFCKGFALCSQKDSLIRGK